MNSTNLDQNRCNSSLYKTSLQLITTYRNWSFSFSSSICTSDRPSVTPALRLFFLRFDDELGCGSGCICEFCSFRLRPRLGMFASSSVDFWTWSKFLLFCRFGRNDFGTFASVNFIILSILVFAIGVACFNLEISFFLTRNSVIEWFYQLHGPTHQW